MAFYFLVVGWILIVKYMASGFVGFGWCTSRLPEAWWQRDDADGVAAGNKRAHRSLRTSCAAIKPNYAAIKPNYSESCSQG